MTGSDGVASGNGTHPAETREGRPTNEHPDRIRALRRFRARLLDWLEREGNAEPLVDARLTGEGGCRIDINLGDGEWAWLTLETNTEL